MASQFDLYRQAVLRKIAVDQEPTYWPWQVETIELPTAIAVWRIATIKIEGEREQRDTTSQEEPQSQPRWGN